jgi:hypothetical protein
MMDAANPPDCPLEAEPEPGMHERSVFPQVEVPAVGFDGQTFVLDPRE